MSSQKEILSAFASSGSFSHLPIWARDAILAGVYQQGRADALKYAFDENNKKKCEH